MMTRLLGALGIFVAISLMSACAANSPSSPSKNTQVTWQAQRAIDLGYGPLWPGIQPTLANGGCIITCDSDKQIGSGWLTLTPTLDELQISELLARLVSEIPAIVWMNTHGYPTTAAYITPAQYLTIRFPLHDMQHFGGSWNLVPRTN